MLFKIMNSLSLGLHIQSTFSPILNLYYTVYKKGNLSPRFYCAQLQLTSISKLKINHTPGQNWSVADMLCRSFTKTELKLNQLKHEQLPPQIDFVILQNNSLTPVHYLIQHEEVSLPDQKHDSHPILADYGTDQFSIRINDKGNDIIVNSLDSFSFKSIIPFQNKIKSPAKKRNKALHQQSLLLNDTDVTTDDDDHIYTRIPKSVTFSSNIQTNDTYQTPTLTRSNSSSTIARTETSSLSTSVIDTTEPIKLSSHTSQIIPFYDPSFFKYKNYFQGFFLPDDFSLDLETLQLQQTQDAVLKTVYHWTRHNTKHEYTTPLIHGSLFPHAYHKI